MVVGAKRSSAERYLQAAAASTVLSALPEHSRARAIFFANSSDFLVASFLEVGPSGWTFQLAAAQQVPATSQGL